MSQSAACLYRPLDGGIHEFTFTEASMQAVDESLAYLEQIYQAPEPAGESMHLLWDFSRAGMPPMFYSYRRVKALNAGYPNRPPVRLAYLMDGFGLAGLAQNLLAQLARSHDSRKFFLSADRDRAITWLLEG